VRARAWLLLPLLVWRIDAALAGESVPVIGCPSDGQTGPLEPPAKSVASLDVDPKTAQQLAYYQAAEGPKVLGPRGWYCFGQYGSSGTELIVAPKRLDVSNPAALKIPGPGISLTLLYGGTSGRFAVARYAARFFPKRVPNFVSAVDRELEELKQTEPREAPSFATDTYQEAAPNIVKFETPGAQEGVGTTGPLVKSADPVSGLITLTVADEEPDLRILRVRLSPQQRALMDTIVQTMQTAD
jgi:hypothetical protein